MVGPDRGDVELRERRAACSAETPPSVCESSSKVSRLTIGSAEIARTADRGDELVELVERLDHEEVDAAALEQLRLLGEDGVAILRRAAERTDRRRR